MHLVEFVPFFSVLALASLALASVALSLLVWRRRGLGAQEGHSQMSWLRRCGLPLAVLGGLLLTVSLCLRTFFPRRGEVFLRDAVVVRADDSRGTPIIEDASTREAGEDLVSFVRRGQDAEIAALRLERDRIVIDAKRLVEAPDKTDAAVIRREIELATERRALAQRRTLIEIEQRRLAQETRRDLLDRRIRRHDVKTQLGEYDGKLQRIAALLNYDTLLVEQSRDLHEAEFISKASLARRQRDTQVSVADRQRLQIERKEKQALLEALDRGIARLDTALTGHASQVAVSTAKLDVELGELKAAEDVWSVRSESDRLRCDRERESEQRKLRIRREKCDAELEGIAQRSSEVAPFRGSILYRHEAPSAAQTGEPILLFGPEGFVRARFRLSEAEARWLRDAGDVPLLVTSDGLLDPHISGSLVSSSPLDHEPGMALVELSCAATQIQARFLARGVELETRLLWAPNLSADPLFLLGLGGFVCGLLMFLRPGRARPSRVVKTDVEEPSGGLQEAVIAPPEQSVEYQESCRRRYVRRVAGERRTERSRRRELKSVTVDRRATSCRRSENRRVTGERRARSD